MDTVYRNYEDVPADRAGNDAAAGRPETLTRKEVSDLMFRADTLEQCAEAWKARSEYLRAHPDDTGILEEGESLWMTEQALKHQSKQSEVKR